MALDRISEKFAQIKAEGRTGLVLFLTAGVPDMAATLELVPALVKAGADCVELGVPFSDPLADGPTIQASNFQALQNGVTLSDCILAIGAIRNQVPDTPLVLMGYYNPILSYGLPAFGKDAHQSGVDGVIVPDLPAEESAPLLETCVPNDLHLIPLLAPTSTDSRIERACSAASGFVYCVSLAGVTGARDDLTPGVFQLLERVRRHTSLPLAVGFGISRRDHVTAIGEHAEAAVVGSALLQVIMGSPRNGLVEKAMEYVQELRGAIPSLNLGDV